MIFEIIITIFLVLLNGFFVAAEFAIVKVRASQIELKASRGHTSAKVAKDIVANLDAYLSATQLGITLASLGLGWIGEEIVAKLVLQLFHALNLNMSDVTAHKVALPVAFATITILHIVFGELAPKTIAIRYPLETTVNISWPLRVFHFIFRPFIWMLNGLASLVLRSIGLRSVHDQDIHSEEEIRLLLTESEEGGAIKASEHDLIQNVFEFDDRIVKQILVPRNKVGAIDINMSNDEIIDKVLEEGYSRLPVYKNSLDNILGIIHTKDLLKVIKHKDFKGINDIIRPAYYIPESKRVNELLREFQTHHYQMAIVTNEFGGTEGIVTMEDVIEELVGEIQDEYDEEKPPVEKVSETEFIVNAQSAIHDVNELLPVALPESSEYETVSGFVNHLFGKIPSVNEKRVCDGFTIIILKRFKHSVEFVKILVHEDAMLSESKS